MAWVPMVGSRGGAAGSNDWKLAGGPDWAARERRERRVLSDARQRGTADNMKKENNNKDIGKVQQLRVECDVTTSITKTLSELPEDRRLPVLKAAAILLGIIVPEFK